MAHGAVAAMCYFGVTHFPRIEDQSLLERYSARQLDLHAIDPPESEAPLSSTAANDFYPDTESRASVVIPQELRKAMRSFIESATGTRTLPPEFHSHLALVEQLPLPNPIIWNAELEQAREIVAPQPAQPADEVALSAALRWVTRLNEKPGTPAGDPQQTLSFAAWGNNRPRPGVMSDLSAEAAKTDDEAIDDSRLTAEHIELAKNGRFGVVVVGHSVGQDYPEALEIWGSRVAYTAYLHVGLSKNWILQYSALRSAEGADDGAVTRLEAPWPYDIFRPNLTSRDLNTAALMIHGTLTSAGRFESLAIAFPARFRYASFVLHLLRQWQFRPARRNGQATAVEVLLIIPDETE